MNQTTPQFGIPSIEERLAALKAERGSRQLVEPSTDDRQCVLTLRLPQSVISGMSDEDVYSFLKNDGTDTLMRAYLGATAVSAPRGGDVSVGCKADSHGGVECHGEVSIHF